MIQRRGYPRGWQERSGQVNPRSEPSVLPATIKSLTPPGEPDCCIIVTKRKGFGSTGNKESDRLSIHGAKILLSAMPQETFFRYKVDIYVKDSSLPKTLTISVYGFDFDVSNSYRLLDLNGEKTRFKLDERSLYIADHISTDFIDHYLSGDYEIWLGIASTAISGLHRYNYKILMRSGRVVRYTSTNPDRSSTQKGMWHA